MACPADEALVAFSLGELPELAAAELLAHAESCSDCQRRLEAFDRQRDRVVDVLRGLGSAGSSPATAPPLSGLPGAGADPLRSPEGRPLEQLGDFRLLREVGRGGMGAVFEAEQLSLGRRVAVKILLTAAQFDAERRARFQREAQAVAQLHHTHIVPVFGTGVHEGVYYYVMPFIPWPPLDQILRCLREPAAPAPTGQDPARVVALALRSPSLPGPTGYDRRVAALCRQVAEALEHAHGKGILHRDIKPSNLLVDDTGGVWVTDFGVASLEGRGRLTGPSDVFGTVGYMAPERFNGQSDARSDIYSLGLVLYELLTLRPAFDALDAALLLLQTVEANITAPRHCRPQIPLDLETICLKCLAKAPDQRYQTAAELAEDLRLFLAGRSIRARPVGYVPAPDGQAILIASWGERWLHLYNARDGSLLANPDLPPHYHPNMAGFSRDGRCAVVDLGHFGFPGASQLLRLRTDDGRRLGDATVEAGLSTLIPHPDGRRMLVLTSRQPSGTIAPLGKLLDPVTGKTQVVTLPQTLGERAFRFHPEGRYGVLQDREGRLRLWGLWGKPIGPSLIGPPLSGCGVSPRRRDPRGDRHRQRGAAVATAEASPGFAFRGGPPRRGAHGTARRGRRGPQAERAGAV